MALWTVSEQLECIHDGSDVGIYGCRWKQEGEHNRLVATPEYASALSLIPSVCLFMS